MASLLVSTAGVSIHRVYCYCMKQESVSLLFSKDGCCEKLSSKNSCCEKSTDKKHRCTDRSTTIAKLDAKFLPTSFSTELPDFQWVSASPAPVFFENPFSCPPQKLLPDNRPPPPFESGRELRVRLCSHRC